MSTIVGVFAHPDDEAFGPGGTLAKLAQKNDVHLICCTDGNHQDRGLKSVRDKELQASAHILGLKKVHFLGFQDGSLSNNSYPELSTRLLEILKIILPETIITFDSSGVSGHIDHLVVTSVINYLFPNLPSLRKIMYFCMKDTEREKISDYFVYMPPGCGRSEIDEVVDVSYQWTIKVEAMYAHVSQKADCDRILPILESLPKEEWFKVRHK